MDAVEKMQILLEIGWQAGRVVEAAHFGPFI
jgi:hypothetical protein